MKKKKRRQTTDTAFVSATNCSTPSCFHVADGTGRRHVTAHCSVFLKGAVDNREAFAEF